MTPKNVGHFAINADEPARARRFYERVFGWKFRPWGPPGSFQITTGSREDPGIPGSLRRRLEIAEGLRVNAYECSISVASVDETAAAVEAAGGKVVMQKVLIQGIGKVIYFQDPEGNLVGAIEFGDAGD